MFFSIFQNTPVKYVVHLANIYQYTGEKAHSHRRFFSFFIFVNMSVIWFIRLWWMLNPKSIRDCWLLIALNLSESSSYFPIAI